MGTWGDGIFDNDPACDLAAKIERIISESLFPEIPEFLLNSVAAAKILLVLKKGGIPPIHIEIDTIRIAFEKGKEVAALGATEGLWSDSFEREFNLVFEELLELFEND